MNSEKPINFPLAMLTWKCALFIVFCSMIMCCKDSQRLTSYDLFPVHCAGKYGFIDQYGRVRIDFEYDSARQFADGLAPVKVKEKWGFTKRDGQIAIPVEYDEVWDFAEGVAVVSKDTKEGMIDTSGKYILELRKIQLKFSNMSDGMIPFRDDPHSLWGYLDTNGKVAINPQYVVADNFSEGLALVVDSYNRVTYIDKKNIVQIKLPNNVQAAGPFSDGWATIEIGGKWGLINKSGSNEVPFDFDGFGGESGKSVFSEGLIAVKNANRWGFLNKQKLIEIKCDFDDVGKFSCGLAPVKKNKLWGYINHKGIEVIPCRFVSAEEFSSGLARIAEGPIRLSTDWKSEYINSRGEIVWNGECSLLDRFFHKL